MPGAVEDAVGAELSLLALMDSVFWCEEALLLFIPVLLIKSNKIPHFIVY